MLPHILCSTLSNAFRARHAFVAVPHTSENLAILAILLKQGFILSVNRGSSSSQDPNSFLTSPVAERRIWARLKYRDDVSVLRAIELISKPSKKIYMDSKELWRLCTGRRAKFIKPLGLGEIAIVQTGTNAGKREWMEIREAIQAKKGGEVICRAR